MDFYDLKFSYIHDENDFPLHFSHSIFFTILNRLS